MDSQRLERGTGQRPAHGREEERANEEREGNTMKVKRCDHCGTLFMPDKYHPRQRYCTDPDCAKDRRRAYKREYNKEWREKNPNYFKEYWLRYREL